MKRQSGGNMSLHSPYIPVACQIVTTYIIATAVLIVIAPKLKKKNVLVSYFPLFYSAALDFVHDPELQTQCKEC